MKKIITILLACLLVSAAGFAQTALYSGSRVILNAFDISAISGTDSTFIYQIPNQNLTVSSYWTSITGSGTLEVEFSNDYSATTWFEYDDADPVSITLTGTDQQSDVLIDPGFKYVKFKITKGTVSAGTLKVIVYLF